MVYHRCLLCIDDSIKQVTMLTRKKRAAASSSSRVPSHKCIAESVKIDKVKNLTQKDEIQPAKRSRGKGNVPVDVHSPYKQCDRKRKTETADPNKNKKLKTLKKGQQELVKTYCWICQKLAQGQTCTCNRVYHDECLVKISKVFNNDKCPECQMQSVNGTEVTRPFIDGLKGYLEFATKCIMEKHNKEMLSWPQNNDIVPDIDIQTLLKKVQNNSYKTTAECYADMKLIYHNYIVLYGENSKQSKDMKKIIKDFKEELFDMEACPECYFHLYIRKPDDSDDENCEYANCINDEFFVRLCNPPHDIVWAKVPGYSHFPAKCLKIINGKARVRFFGKHAKSDIPINTIFCISREHPVHEKKNIMAAGTRTSLEYTYAKREILEYVRLYEENVGNFQFFGFRVFYESYNADSKTTKKTLKPGLVALTTTSPPISTPTGFETAIPSSNSGVSINMTFCADTHTPDSFTPASVSSSCIQERENTAVQSTSFENQSLPVADSNTASPVSSTASSISSSNSGISINMTFCADTHSPDSFTPALVSSSCIQERENTAVQNTSSENPSIPIADSNTASPVSTTASFAAISIRNMANPHGFQIKEEFEQANQMPSLTDPSGLMQMFRNSLVSHCRISPDGGSPSFTESDLASMLQNFNAQTNSEIEISHPISVPDLSIVKNENNGYLPSTSQAHQPEKQITTKKTTENASTIGNRQSHEPKVGCSSSNLEIEVVDLTEDDDSTPLPRLSNLLYKNPHMQDLFERAHQAVDTCVMRLCEEVIKRKQTPAPSQECRELNKKLDEAQKNVHNAHKELQNVRDRINEMQKSVTEK